MRQCLAIVFVATAMLAPTRAHADLKVIATTADLASVAAEIGGKHASVITLALPTQDPHFVDARPHLALDLARADLLIAVGLELEVGWLPTLQTGSRNGKVLKGARGYLDCSQLIDVLDVPRERVDRSMGDIHPGGNPHYMFDPRRVAKVAAGIAARMAELDPGNTAAYQAGLQHFLGKLESARKRWEQALASLRGQKVVSYHRSLTYFADWLGLTVSTQIEPKPGIPPSPRDLANILSLMKAQGVKLVLQEEWYPANASQMLAEHAGARVVRLPGGPDYDHGKNYFDFMDTLVARLRSAP
ncbi:MAG TPA: metal ABC transporter substrate-binding protein [Polyangiales bacterium]